MLQPSNHLEVWRQPLVAQTRALRGALSLLKAPSAGRYALLVATLLLPAPASAQFNGEQRFYDRAGRFQGTARTAPGGDTRFYDRQGRYTGRADPHENGRTRFYDQQGRFTGESRGSSGSLPPTLK